MKAVGSYIRKYPLSLVAVVVILYLSFFKPPKTGLDEITNFDKMVHFSMYFCFCSVIWVEYIRCHKVCSVPRLLIGTLFLPIAMSGFIELGQEYLTQYRSGDWWDFACNVGGAVAALCVFMSIFVVKMCRTNNK